MIWIGKQNASYKDLAPFLEIRKTVVLQALHCLIQYHSGYADIQINNTLIDSWPNIFIPETIRDTISHITEEELEASARATYVPEYNEDAIPELQTNSNEDNLPEIYPGMFLTANIELQFLFLKIIEKIRINT